MIISPQIFVNLGLVSLSKNLKTAITQVAIDGNFFQGPFCVHMGVVFQKNALPTLLQFARVKKTYQPHVIYIKSPLVGMSMAEILHGIKPS